MIYQFLSPAANRRTDVYGGPFENRIRFLAEIVEGVRGVWPKGKPLFVRLSCIDYAGWEIEDILALARVLKQSGVDVIDCSTGGLVGSPLPEGVTPDYGYQVDYAARVRAAADIATVGLIVHADHAERILQDGAADLIAIGRELMYNPNWPIDVAQKFGADPDFAATPARAGFWLRGRARDKPDLTPSTYARKLRRASMRLQACAPPGRRALPGAASADGNRIGGARKIEQLEPSGIELPIFQRLDAINRRIGGGRIAAAFGVMGLMLGAMAGVMSLVLAMRLGEHRAAGRRAGDGDGRAFPLHHLEQFRRIAGRKPYAAMRSRAAERAGRVGAVDGVAAAEEDRMRHRRVVIFARIMHLDEMARAIASARRHIALPRRRDRPDIIGAAVFDAHRLR